MSMRHGSPNGENRFDDHTLVITTFNRPAQLAQLLSFIANDGPVGQILIADGSDDANHALNCKAIASLAGPQTATHVRTPANLKVLEMYRWAVEAVETSFMTLVHDDNFVILDCVRACIKQLRQDAGLVVCSGRIVYGSRSSRVVELQLGSATSIEHADALQRVADYIGRYWSLDFGTWRTAARRAILPALALYDLDEAVAEPLHNALAATFGKFRVLDRVGVVFRTHDANNFARTISNRLAFAGPHFRMVIDAGAALLSPFLGPEARPKEDLVGTLIEAFIDHVITHNSLFSQSIARSIFGLGASGVEIGKMREMVVQMRIAAREALLDPALCAQLPAPGLQETNPNERSSDHRPLMLLQRDMLTVQPVACTDAEELQRRHPFRMALKAAMERVDWSDRVSALLTDVRMNLTVPSMAGQGELQKRALLLSAIATDLGLISTRGAFRSVDMDADTEAGALHRDALSRVAVLIGENPDSIGAVRAAADAARSLRIVCAQPQAPVTLMPDAISLANARTSNGTTLVPFRWAERAEAAMDARAWVRVQVRLDAGKLQLGVVADGDFQGIAVVGPQQAEQTVYLPVVIGHTQLFVIRDLSTAERPLAGAIECVDVVTQTDTRVSETMSAGLADVAA